MPDTPPTRSRGSGGFAPGKRQAALATSPSRGEVNHEWTDGPVSYDRVDHLVGDPLLAEQRWPRWWLAFGVSAGLTLLMIVVLGAVFLPQGGVGIWGTNTMIVWGFPIAGYVWWIGIGNAGTLISALLLLTRQPW